MALECMALDIASGERCGNVWQGPDVDFVVVDRDFFPCPQSKKAPSAKMHRSIRSAGVADRSFPVGTMQKLSTTAGQPSAGFLLPRTDTGKELPTFQAPKITMGICRQIAAQLGVVHPGELPKLYRPANGGIPSTSL